MTPSPLPMTTRLRPGTDPAALAEAASLLQAGELVAFPTETVYGLGADGLCADAVAKIYLAKGRPSSNPLILHVPDAEAARDLVTEWPDTARRLAAAFWPGPLTLVLPAAACVPEIVRAGNPTVAVRCPAHPVALALLRATQRPLAAPSANRSTEISPSTAAHVLHSLQGRVPLVLDGGPTRAGVESTIVDLSRGTPRLLRPGPLAPEVLESLIGPLQRWQGFMDGREAQPAPGMARRHYAPRTPTSLLAFPELSRQVLANPEGVAVVVFVPTPRDWPSGLPVRRLPLDAKAVEAQLYALLHELDGQGHARILIQEPPHGDAWLAVRDRLMRAAAEA